MICNIIFTKYLLIKMFFITILYFSECVKKKKKKTRFPTSNLDKNIYLSQAYDSSTKITLL